MANQKALENISGLKASPMKANGSMDWGTELECGKEQKEIVMLGSGGWARQKDMEFMYGLMGTVMKEISRPV
jgi:hypothetical protein